jgi:outer membrane protein TolC
MKRTTPSHRISLFFSLLFLLAGCLAANAQNPPPGSKKPVNSAPVTPPLYKAPVTQPVRSLPPAPDSIEEKLVALALTGPQFRTSESQNKINEYQLRSARSAWMNILSLSLSYNDQSFQKAAIPGAYTYPKYFFGLNIPLGTLFSRSQINAAKEGVKMGKYTQEQLQRTIRVQVLTKYKEYKNFGELIKLQNDVVVTEQAAVNKIEARINDASVSIDIYKGAIKSLNTEKGTLLNLQLQRDITKLELEQMIGTSLESVIN